MGRKGLSGKQRGLLILLAALVLVVLECVGIYRHYIRPPETIRPDAPDADGKNGSASGTNRATVLDPETGEELDVELELPGSHKKGFYNILIVGTDNDGTRTDTIIIARLDISDHTVAMLSVPRDTYINANYNVPKINGAYGVGGMGEEGMAYLKKQLTGILGFEVDGYVMVDLDAFVETVDLIGGVEFDVPQNMYYSDPTQDLYINLKAGVQRLDGQRAMQLVRYRKYAQADIQRMSVQQQFLTAMAKQCLTIGNLGKLNEFAKIFKEYVQTDLSLGNMIYFAQELVKCDFDQMQTYTLPGEGVWINGGSYYQLYPKQVLEIVNESFNPYDSDIPLSNLHIRQTGSGTSGGQTSGSTGSGSSSGTGTAQPSGGGSTSGGQTQPSEPTEPETPAEDPQPTDPEVQNPLIEEPEDTGTAGDGQTPEENSPAQQPTDQEGQSPA